MKEPKYLVQLLERSEHFCKTFKLVTLASLPRWIEEMESLIAVCNKHNPTHSYVMYISNNSVDLAKGESLLIQQEAIKKLKGEQSKIGITTSTKAMYLGMGRATISYDFDTDLGQVQGLRKLLVAHLENNKFVGMYTCTPKGMHVHLPAKDNFRLLDSLPVQLSRCLDKVGNDLCSPIEGTYKDGYLITKHKI